jgi:hypothetical protein
MKSLKKNFPYVVITILVLILLFQNRCSVKNKPGDVVKIDGKKYGVVEQKIDTFYQTKVQVVYRRGKDIFHRVEVIKEIPSKVDTASILKDYYSSVFYTDTFRLKDTLGYIAVNDTISENRIVGRKYYSSINIPTIEKIIYLKEIRNSWLVGASFQLGPTSSLGGDLFLKSKRENLFGLGVGINANLTPYVKGTVGWKIK